MTFEQVVLLLSLLGGAIYITFQISWTIFNSKKEGPPRPDKLRSFFLNQRRKDADHSQTVPFLFIV